jgi:hypothetical protein
MSEIGISQQLNGAPAVRSDKKAAPERPAARKSASGMACLILSERLTCSLVFALPDTQLTSSCLLLGHDQ